MSGCHMSPEGMPFLLHLQSRRSPFTPHVEAVCCAKKGQDAWHELRMLALILMFEVEWRCVGSSSASAVPPCNICPPTK